MSRVIPKGGDLGCGPPARQECVQGTAIPFLDHLHGVLTEDTSRAGN